MARPSVSRATSVTTGEEPQVRVSVWSEALGSHLRADAAVSLTEDEAERLARFLADVPAPDEAQTL